MAYGGEGAPIKALLLVVGSGNLTCVSSMTSERPATPTGVLAYVSPGKALHTADAPSVWRGHLCVRDSVGSTGKLW